MAEMLDYADRREAKERIWYIIKKCIESTNAKIQINLALVDLRMTND